MANPRDGRKRDPFAPLKPLLGAVAAEPLRPVLFVLGDDGWIVGEAVKRLTSAFQTAFPEGEVAVYEGGDGAVREAVADASTLPLFASHRLVVLDGNELLKTRKLTAEELDAILDEAKEDGRSGAAARKMRALASAAGIEADATPEDAGRRLTGRVKRSDRAAEVASLLAATADDAETPAGGSDRLADFVSRATPSENVLLVHAVSPDREHGIVVKLLKTSPVADLTVPDEEARRDRLASLGLERALDRGVTVDPEVFDILSDRGRREARAFLLELDRLIATATRGRVTAESAARLVADESKEYGSDFVEAFASRHFLEARAILEKLLSGGEFTAFRPGARDEGAPRKGPRGDAAFFPILGLLAGEVRRMLAMKSALTDRAIPARRADYRTFTDRLLPSLRSAPSGVAPLAVDAHPFVLFKSYQASFEWELRDLVAALSSLEAVDRGVKTGVGTGPELLEGFLLARARPHFSS